MEMYQLLLDMGIPVDKNDWIVPTVEPVVPDYEPIRFENNIAIFNSNQVEKYGSPDLYGYTQFHIIETNETASPFVTDWEMEQTRWKARPIHRYNRVERFEFVLAQLLGLRGDIPFHVMGVVEQYADRTPQKCWNSIRGILKHYGYRKYYNRIPQMIYKLGLGTVFSWDNSDTTYRAIITDFKMLQHIFENNKKRQEWKRTYFPSLRFIAIKLLEKYGATCNFEIAFIRTKRKQKALNDIWNTF